LDNLMLGAYTVTDSQQVRSALSQVFHYFPRLSERRRQPVGSLSGGEQQMVALGRALMANPTMLVLDEPSIGLGPMVIQSVFDTIARISREKKVSVLVTEQNARQALRIAQHAYLIEAGRQVAEGSPKKLMENDAIRAAYLGTEPAPL
jgi:branched-chain amino acid transport system ATP-binding protein